MRSMGYMARESWVLRGGISVVLLLSWGYFGWDALFLECICGDEEFYECFYTFLGAEYIRCNNVF